MAPRSISSVDELKSLVGEHLGHSEWIEVTQEMVDQFADATGDHQWIHVDVERATQQSPFGGPIAHGYLTLSLIPRLLPMVVSMSGFRMGVNYGCNKVRFITPVPVGARLRGGFKLKEVTDVPGGVQNTWEATVELEGAAKPACFAEVVYQSYV